MDRTWLTPRIYTIDGFFSEGECTEAIARSEREGFDEAPITTHRGPVMDKGIRNNRRVMVDDPDYAARLWARLASVAPPDVGTATAIGLNERFRYYRYDFAERFAPHFDGHFRRDDSERSYWTFMVYLNDGFLGGETNFFETGQRAGDVVTVWPRRGTALLFLHAQLHEGAPVLQGRKYVLRTDVMYRVG